MVGHELSLRNPVAVTTKALLHLNGVAIPAMSLNKIAQFRRRKSSSKPARSPDRPGLLLWGIWPRHPAKPKKNAALRAGIPLVCWGAQATRRQPADCYISGTGSYGAWWCWDKVTDYLNHTSSTCC